jgi:hypothetical protein
MKIRRILIEEIIRAFAFGAVVFMTLSFFYRSKLLSLSALYFITLALMVVMFVCFTIVRIRTGQELKVQGALGYSIVAATLYAFALTFVSVGVVLGQAAMLFPHGFWSVAAWVISPGLFTWIGYKTSEKHPPQN